jgi:hypothetical protein
LGAWVPWKFLLKPGQTCISRTLRQFEVWSCRRLLIQRLK